MTDAASKVDAKDKEGKVSEAERQKWNKCYQILPHLFLAGHRVADTIPQLRELGITHVLNVTSDNPPSKETKAELDVLYFPIDDKPSQDLSEALAVGDKFIAKAIEAKGRVLVHCSVGQSRSASIVLHHVMKHKNCTLAEALDHVKGIKRDVSPNHGFISQLCEEEHKRTGKRSVDVTAFKVDQIMAVLPHLSRDTVAAALTKARGDPGLAVSTLMTEGSG